MTNARYPIARGLFAIAATLLAAFSAHAQIATFTEIDDAAPGVCYDPATTAPDAADPNTLRIGVHSGTDPASFANRACIASTAAFHARQRTDTIAVRVEAPPGFYVSQVTFSQAGSATSSRVGQVFAGAQWVVDGDALGAALTGASADLTGLYRTVVPVSFSVFLGAKINGTSGSASASVSNPMLTVQLLPLPVARACGLGHELALVLPALAWLRRRRRA